MPITKTFTIVYQRDNKVKKAFNDFFLMISSYPRLLIEVFTRKQFGQRYFSIPSVIFLSLIMLYLPFMFSGNLDFSHPKYYGTRGSFLGEFATWYIYTAAFIILSIMHLSEIRLHGSVFSGKRLSLSTGVLHKFFDNIPAPFGIPRLREILIEPLPFFILGLILSKFDQELGTLLKFCSIIYSLSYVAAYNGGDNLIMDKVDQIIFNEELENVFMNDAEPQNARGVKIYSDKPTAGELRQNIYETLASEEETVVAV